MTIYRGGIIDIAYQTSVNHVAIANKSNNMKRKKSVIKAWAVVEEGELVPYQFSRSGERTLMTFPTRHDAMIFRGRDERYKIAKILISFPKKKLK